MRYRDLRLPCDTPVTVLAGGAAQEGEVTNLSGTGARIRGLQGRREGEVVQVRFLDLRIDARVMWARGPEVGVRFLAELTRAQMVTLRREVGGGGRERRPTGLHPFREMT